MDGPGDLQPAERVALALGSNIGDRRGLLAEAVARLGNHIEILRVSSLYETAPVGNLHQPDFLNVALTAETDLEPAELLALAQSVEQAAGRVRTHVNGPRSLDVDIVLYGARVIDEPGLSVPHPRWRGRGFVWAPLNEIAPTWVDPAVGRTVAEIGITIDRSGVHRIDDPTWVRGVPC